MKPLTYNLEKTKKCFIKILIFFLLCVTSYKLQVTRVSAQQVSLSIAPPLVELFIKPGKSVLVAYNVENLSDPTILSTKVRPFSPKGNNGQIKIKDEFEGPIRFTLENANLALEEAFFLKTKQNQQLLLKIRVPEGTPNGDYYYTFLVETKPLKNIEGSTSSSANAAIGANILITVTESGNVDIKGKVALFDVIPRYRLKLFGLNINLFESNDNVPVILILENRGKNLIKPQGEITLLGNFGERAKFNILPQNILGESQRLIQATPSAEIDCENSRRKQACLFPTSFAIPGFFVGKYRLSTSLNFGESTPNISASTSFYAMPIKFLIGAAAAVIMIVFIIKRIKE